jgi:hypothetical protein
MKEFNEELQKAIAGLLEWFEGGVLENFSEVLPLLYDGFNDFEYETIHQEICRCLLLDLNHASITLTNHLLEKHLKNLLIKDYIKSEKANGSTKDDDEISAKACKNFGGLMLYKTIESCFQKGLISEVDRAYLDQYREVFRNGFSHADMNKIAGNTTKTLFKFKFDDPSFFEKKEYVVAQTPMLFGIETASVADSNALRYYKHIHVIIKRSNQELKK